MTLPPKPPRRRNETRDLVKPIIAALNRTGLVRVARNNVGFVGGIRYGLGIGSPDIVGILRGSGRVFCLEVKWPGKRLGTDQRRSQALIRSFGGYAYVVHSLGEALAFLSLSVEAS